MLLAMFAFVDSWDGVHRQPGAPQTLRERVYALTEHSGPVGDAKWTCNRWAERIHIGPLFDMRQYGIGNAININVQSEKKDDNEEEEEKPPSTWTILAVAAVVGGGCFGVLWALHRTYKDQQLDGELEAEQTELAKIEPEVPSNEHQVKEMLAAEIGAMRAWMGERIRCDRLLCVAFGSLWVAAGGLAHHKLGRGGREWMIIGALAAACFGAAAWVFYPSAATRKRVEETRKNQYPNLPRPHPPDE